MQSAYQYRQTDHEAQEIVNLQAAKDLAVKFLAGQVKQLKDWDEQPFSLNDFSVWVFEDSRFVSAMSAIAKGDHKPMTNIINERAVLAAAIDLFGEYYAEQLLGIER